MLSILKLISNFRKRHIRKQIELLLLGLEVCGRGQSKLYSWSSLTGSGVLCNAKSWVGIEKDSHRLLLRNIVQWAATVCGFYGSVGTQKFLIMFETPGLASVSLKFIKAAIPLQGLTRRLWEARSRSQLTSLTFSPHSSRDISFEFGGSPIWWKNTILLNVLGLLEKEVQIYF